MTASINSDALFIPIKEPLFTPKSTDKKLVPASKHQVQVKLEKPKVKYFLVPEIPSTSKEDERPTTPELTKNKCIKDKCIKRSSKALKQPRSSQGVFICKIYNLDCTSTRRESATPIEFTCNIVSTDDALFKKTNSMVTVYNNIKSSTPIQIQIQIQSTDVVFADGVYFTLRLINTDGDVIEPKKSPSLFSCNLFNSICIKSAELHTFNIRINEIQRNCSLQIKESSPNAEWKTICTNLYVRTKIPK